MDTSGSQAESKPTRLRSLDVFRGLTIGAMVLVNNPGTWSAIYPPLRHAKWHGCTPTDLVFPFFLFIIGVAMAFSLRKYTEGEKPTRAFWVRLLRRVGVLILLGLFLNAFMAFGRLALGDVESFREGISTLRFTGVLQRIALAYLVATLLIVLFRTRGQVIASAGILLGHWLLLRFGGPDGAQPFDPIDNIARTIDHAIIGQDHLYRGTDPEGLLGTLPAAVSVVVGFWVGRWIRSNTMSAAALGRLGAVGVAAVLIGLLWSLALPLNKPLWTGSYVVSTSGWAVLILAACVWIVDLRHARLGVRALEAMGVNAIFLFVASGVMARLLLLAPAIGAGSEHATLKGQLAAAVMMPWMSAELGSLMFALCNVAFWAVVLRLMHAKGWTFRV